MWYGLSAPDDLSWLGEIPAPIQYSTKWLDRAYIDISPENIARRAMLGSFRAAVMARDAERCWLCGYPVSYAAPHLRPTLDHVLPTSLGGKDVLSNLRLAHEHCNHIRGSRNPKKAWERLASFAARFDPQLRAYRAAPASFWRPPRRVHPVPAPE
jgi:RNA-directed DNA polymerase